MSYFSTWSERLPDLGAVIKRFPIAAAIMALVTLYFGTFGVDSKNHSVLMALLGLTLSAYLAMMQTLWAEARVTAPNWILQILMAIGFAALFYHAEYLRIYFVMLIPAVLLILGNSVRFGRARDDLHVWDFTHQIWTAAGFAALGCGIYLLGVMAIMAALKSLFGLNIEVLIEHLVLPIGLGLLAPLYWLSNIPPVDEPYGHLTDEPSFVSKAVAFLGTWILAPLTLIYAVILLAYGLKILLQMGLPKGEIAQLTLPFLLIGTLTWLLLEPPFIRKNKLAALFRKVWFFLSLPAALMLSVSVFVRVAEYGLTEQRILLILACIWSLVLGVWFSFGPKLRRDIRIIPGLAAALLVLGSMSTYHLSIASQSARLERALQDMKTAQVDDLDAAARAKGALSYLWRRDGREKVQSLVREAGHDVSKTATLRDIFKVINLDTVKLPSRYSNDQTVIRSVIYKYRQPNLSISITGYDFIFGNFHYRFKPLQGQRQVLVLDDVIIRTEDGQIKVYENDELIGAWDLDAWVKTLDFNNEIITLPGGNPVFYEDEARRLGLAIKSMEIILEDDDKQNLLGNMQFYILSQGFNPKL